MKNQDIFRGGGGGGGETGVWENWKLSKEVTEWTIVIEFKNPGDGMSEEEHCIDEFWVLFYHSLKQA